MKEKATLNIDQEEVSKFNKLASQWWEVDGELKTLHQLNPLRLGYIEKITSLKEKKVIDIGCGGGILSEAMANKGAEVSAIDLSEEAIHVAKEHSKKNDLTIDYRLTSAEEIADEKPSQFDIVTCLEMLEHVPEPQSIIQACAKLAKPGGHIFFSTLNRNPKSYLFAVLGAEYILRILPRNTHDYSKFIKPSELANWSREAGLSPEETKGIRYQPLSETFSLNDDVSVNYLMHVTKPL